MKRLIITLLLIPAWAMAQDAIPAKPKSFAELYPPLPGVEYFCTDATGKRMEIGAVICVTASCQTWMARCEMASTNRSTMWRKLQDGCPGASLDGSILGRLKGLKPTV